MRAAAFWAFGPPEVLKYADLETPQAGPGEVRVRVKTAGVQPADCAVRQGWTPPGAEVKLPQIPGNEFAGTLDQLGEGVSGLERGEEVLGFRVLDCYAEYVVVPAAQILHKPATLPWDVAGGLTGAGQTAQSNSASGRATRCSSTRRRALSGPSPLSSGHGYGKVVFRVA